MTVCIALMILSLSLATEEMAYAQADSQTEAGFEQANQYLLNGEYKQAISIYDGILDAAPSNISALQMKAIAHSNLQEHESSLKQFFKVLQHTSDDPIALAGMGVEFGNLGEYHEASSYLKRASEQKPDSIVINNYKEFINRVIAKYPYTPTEKPVNLERQYDISIPEWVKIAAREWSTGNIGDQEFVLMLAYLIENKIIEIPPIDARDISKDSAKLNGVKRDAKLWSEDKIKDEEFVSGIKYIIAKSPAKIQRQFEKSEKDLEKEFAIFEEYLRDISSDISKEKRYIEYSNPSGDVIKKFLRDYELWNFEDRSKRSSVKFPNPTYQITDDTYIITYNVFINDQPTGLPLDHVDTLRHSFAFWEAQELSADDSKAKIKFNVVNLKHEANIWITWVVRNIGEGVLGHAHLGKGIVEVVLGDYNCDGSFQLYDIDSIEYVMTHELGHSIGLEHSDNQNSIMYTAYAPSYAYCLLDLAE